MARSDGNGWMRCRCGQRHWGLHGAAGLVLLRRSGGVVELLLQLRADWTHQGGSWGVPGGARDSHEDVVLAALREANEEVGVDPALVEIVDTAVGTDHAEWRYTYVIRWAHRTAPAHRRNDGGDQNPGGPPRQAGRAP